MSEYPLEMVHPSYSPGKPAQFRNNNGEILPPGVIAGTKVSEGVPSRFNPVTVMTEKDEQYHRTLGYLAKGETPPKVDGYHAYPKMLVHPDHVPGTPDEIHAKPREEGKPLETYMVKGTPEKFPPVVVNDEKEEATWNEKGYRMPELPDPLSFQKAKADPYDPNRKVNGYPRWENGVLVNDPSLSNSGVKEYPKMIGDKIVNSAKEEFELLEAGEFTDAKIQYLVGERRHLSETGDDAGVERIEKLLSDAGIEVKDRPHGTVWKRTEKVAEQPPADDPLRQKEELIAEAESRGVKIDKRWNIDKIRSALSGEAAA